MSFELLSVSRALDLHCDAIYQLTTEKDPSGEDSPERTDPLSFPDGRSLESLSARAGSPHFALINQHDSIQVTARADHQLRRTGATLRIARLFGSQGWLVVRFSVFHAPGRVREQVVAMEPQGGATSA